MTYPSRQAVPPRRVRLCAGLCASLALTACSVPNHMHVTEGVSPKNIDTNVRFRATYYFRVFDFCQSDGNLQAIIPETDVVYRYIMTGKASALGSRIKFEAGTLDENDIDPFGSDLVFQEEIGGYRVRSKDAAFDELKLARDTRAQASEREDALKRYETLAARYDQLLTENAGGATPPHAQDTLDSLKQARDNALAGYTGAINPTISKELDDQLTKIQTDVQGNTAAISALKVTTTSTADAEALAKSAGQAAANDVKQQVVEALAAIPQDDKAKLFAQLCPTSAVRRRGFQLMGPEGTRDFDQSKRVILAMYTSAKPLTETLKEYAGRVTSAKATPADRLLPLVQEGLRGRDAQHALDQIAIEIATGKTTPTVEQMVERTLTEFGAAKEQK